MTWIACSKYKLRYEIRDSRPIQIIKHNGEAYKYWIYCTIKSGTLLELLAE